MTPGDREQARAALSQGRAVYARLDRIRGPEDAAADIVDLWGAAESAMRAMLGGAVLSGQALVRELRQRELLDLEQANALASFWDARSRIDSASYQPTLTDVGYVRAGFNHLSAAVETGPQTAAPPAATQPAAVSAPSIEMPVYGTPHHVAKRSRIPSITPIWIGAAVVLLIALSVVGYVLFGRSGFDKQMTGAINAMQSGQLENARAQFARIASDHPGRAEPHVFLARLARSEGDLAAAHRELELAIRSDVGNAQALREMGLLLLSENKADLARSFLIRAIRADTSDLAAKGYLGCALVRLNRAAEGEKFISRAGPGSWSACAVPPPPVR